MTDGDNDNDNDNDIFTTNLLLFRGPIIGRRSKGRVSEEEDEEGGMKDEEEGMQG